MYTVQNRRCFSKGTNGYKYILLIGDLFSKYLEVVALKDQTAPTIVKAVHERWFCRHGYPTFLLTDQGSNIDGDVMRKICEQFNVKKRRTSGYHSQGNGFAERSIRAVKEMFRTTLLECKIPQLLWKDILPGIVFALNSSQSSSTKLTPYEVVYGRLPVFPTDILMEMSLPNVSAPTPKEYLLDMRIQMRKIIETFNKNLNVSRKIMINQYNRNIKFYDYKPGDQVYVKRKHFKPGENRKLAPRKSGPWTVVMKKENGVNFEIKNDKNITKVIHHDRLVPFKGNIQKPHTQSKSMTKSRNTTTSPKIAVHSDQPFYSSDESSDDDIPVRPAGDNDIGNDDADSRSSRYPLRNRTQRNFEADGYIPWDILEHRF